MHYVTLQGTEARLHPIEIKPADDLRITVDGSADAPKAREIRIRIRSAFAALNLPRPKGAIDIAATAVGVDLPIALALRGDAYVAEMFGAGAVAAIGEITLAGAVRSVRGIVPAAIFAKQAGVSLVVPDAQRHEAAFIGPCHALGVFGGVPTILDHMPGVLDRARSTEFLLSELEGEDVGAAAPRQYRDGVREAAAKVRDALARGIRRIVFVAEHGAGATVVARRIASILPDLTREQAIDIARVQSAAGLPIRIEHPFRAPHHTVSELAMRGIGGARSRPGEIDLARHGILYLDEVSEFSRRTLAAVNPYDIRMLVVAHVEPKYEARCAEFLVGFERIEIARAT
jgi:magnesium chelatase family protein